MLGSGTCPSGCSTRGKAASGPPNSRRAGALLRRSWCVGYPGPAGPCSPPRPLAPQPPGAGAGPVGVHNGLRDLDLPAPACRTWCPPPGAPASLLLSPTTRAGLHKVVRGSSPRPTRRCSMYTAAPWMEVMSGCRGWCRLRHSSASALGLCLLAPPCSSGASFPAIGALRQRPACAHPELSSPGAARQMIHFSLVRPQSSCCPPGLRWPKGMRGSPHCPRGALEPGRQCWSPGRAALPRAYATAFLTVPALPSAGERPQQRNARPGDPPRDMRRGNPHCP